ncbi:N-acetyl-gamma-glutamyl-phosphate reductase [Parvibium lacunae]|uniref:N-acetyl-gamma-glutamyl-phosphate reductase n=1 Tax=Parvibium lacunae TaxID=1888893 RepID=A0A368L290_9BURK|nr:N-acetyl-gamma-glutamyl-phosphate reductase [Parvibium lacunae]RCS57571.1 N-acetyl-gamma-glutamyl-phosphate reductase [Parvibium lacunae]
MIKVGIVGGTGYTGVELLRLLAGHHQVQLQAITSRKEDGVAVADMFPSLRGHVDLAFSSPDKAALDRCDVVFFATPHGVAMAQARELLAAGVRIIDLAADFRLQDTAVFEQWYGMPHTCPELLSEAVYGLPEIHRHALAKARLVGNPGCYPTTVQLGLLPLLEKGGLIDTQHIIADCKSGVSGAGRKAELPYLLTEAGDNFKAYGVKGHRHHPEIVEQLQKIAGVPIHLTFVPHLVPMIRGMFSTLYVTLTDAGQAIDCHALYADRYANEPFVDVLPKGMLPDTRSVRASNMLRIAVHQQGQQLILLVVQDNLTKGAAGQAVQVMNAMFGLPETTGLTGIAVLP